MNTKIFLYPFSSHNDQNPLEASNHGNADKTFWIVITILGITLLLSLIYWLWKRKTKKKENKQQKWIKI